MISRYNRSLLADVCIAVAALGAVACHRVPDSVIQPEQMSQLLADSYTAEALVDGQRQQFFSDSARLAVKQAVLAKHGVDQAKLDSSYRWYAHNPEVYVDMCDRTIEILKQRIGESSARAVKSAVSAPGDSVDLWQDVRYMMVSDRTPTRFVTFNFDADRNTQSGDVYDWHVKYFNNMPRARWTMVADYADGGSEWIDSETATEGWNHLRLSTDSTRVLKRVYGTIELQPYQGRAIYLDSIRLTRRRIDRDSYPYRYQLRKR